MESMTIKRHKKRFQELEDELLRHMGGSAVAALPADRGIESLAADIFANWTTKARSLVASSCGKDSEHYAIFLEAMQPRQEESQLRALVRLFPIFLAIKDDYQKGYATPLIVMARAEVFGDALDQAEEFLSGKHFVAAAVIAGTVLETFMRGQCDSRGIASKKLNDMNIGLTKAGIHSSTDQKSIEFFAKVRNNAAHGEEVEERHVKHMIEGIRQHIRQHSA